jgi:hydroxymethylpyrimidine pyrophosphatase-like HAD family hydrolase
MEKFGAKYQEVESFDKYFDKTLEVVLAGDNRAAIKFIRDKFSFPHSLGLNTSYFKSHTREGIYYLEIRKAGSSKGKGLLRLLKYLKLSPEDAAVIGDWYNDISLFKTNAFKVALSNAVAEIKKMADLITVKNNNEDGTAEFLEMVLKSKVKHYAGKESFKV